MLIYFSCYCLFKYFSLISQDKLYKLGTYSFMRIMHRFGSRKTQQTFITKFKFDTHYANPILSLKIMLM
jgi:hypothetical protein